MRGWPRRLQVLAGIVAVAAVVIGVLVVRAASAPHQSTGSGHTAPRLPPGGGTNPPPPKPSPIVMPSFCPSTVDTCGAAVAKWGLHVVTATYAPAQWGANDGATATCPSGDIAIGGGGFAAEVGGTQAALIASRPSGIDPASHTATAWYAKASYQILTSVVFNDPVAVFAVCVAATAFPSIDIVGDSFDAGYGIGANPGATARCNSGEVAISGGAAAVEASGSQAGLIASRPDGLDSSGRLPSGWYAKASRQAGAGLTPNVVYNDSVIVYAVCASPASVQTLQVAGASYSPTPIGDVNDGAVASCPPGKAAVSGGAVAYEDSQQQAALISMRPTGPNSSIGTTGWYAKASSQASVAQTLAVGQVFNDGVGAFAMCL